MNATTKTARTVVLPAAMALAIAVLDTPTARATPPADPSTVASCVYTLTSPRVVTVSGTDMVTATLKPGPCTGDINMNSLTVCVEMQGGTEPPKCAFHPSFDVVQVYYAPYRAGATYASTGRGCGNVFPTADESCASVGPYRTTL